MANFDAAFLNNDCIFIYDINWSVIGLSRTLIPEIFVTIQPFLENFKNSSPDNLHFLSSVFYFLA